MKMNPRKIGLAISILGVSGSLAWASCGGTEGIVEQSAGTMATSLVGSLTTAATTLVTLNNTNTSAILSSIAILTKQIGASSDQMATAAVGSEQSLAVVAKDVADKELVDKLVRDYTSQGFDPCGQSDATRRMATQEQASRAAVPARVATEIEAVGKWGAAGDVLQARDSRHRALFCTQSEVDAGICSSVGKIPGGDNNAALLFSSDKSSEAVAAKNGTINRIIGLPDNPVPSNVANTPQAQAYVMEKKRKDAFLAWPAYSLKTIQEESENLNPVIDERLSQYFGSPKALDWAKSQAGQATRGILVDLVKLQGVNLKMAERRLRQGMRMEANLAAMLELENQSRSGGSAADAAMVSDAARRKVQ